MIIYFCWYLLMLFKIFRHHHNLSPLFSILNYHLLLLHLFFLLKSSFITSSHLFLRLFLDLSPISFHSNIALIIFFLFLRVAQPSHCILWPLIKLLTDAIRVSSVISQTKPYSPHIISTIIDNRKLFSIIYSQTFIVFLLYRQWLSRFRIRTCAWISLSLYIYLNFFFLRNISILKIFLTSFQRLLCIFQSLLTMHS